MELMRGLIGRVKNVLNASDIVDGFAVADEEEPHCGFFSFCLSATKTFGYCLRHAHCVGIGDGVAAFQLRVAWTNRRWLGRKEGKLKQAENFEHFELVGVDAVEGWVGHELAGQRSCWSPKHQFQGLIFGCSAANMPSMDVRPQSRTESSNWHLDVLWKLRCTADISTP